MTKVWWKESVVYQIYPRSFNDSNHDGIGDIQGIIEKLDYLKELGIDVIWLSPVYDSPNDDNGYDIRHYQKIMKEFGTMDDWERLLENLHARGIKLMMDLVVNHTSDEHRWFQEAEKSKDNPYRDYYIWRSGKDDKEPNNWESFFKGSAWEYNEATEDYYLHLFSKKQPDLNWENEKVRSEVYKMMKWWFDKGVDGFRMDVINLISKDPNLPDGEVKEGKKYGSSFEHVVYGPRIHEFLNEMNQEVLSNYDCITVGEMPEVTTEAAVKYTDEERNELNMIFHFEHMGVDVGPKGKFDLKPYSLVELKRILNKWQLALQDKGWNSLYWDNHDQPRVVSRFGNDKKFRIESAKMLATTLHFMKGTPYIYQGEEIGMTNIAFDDLDKYQDIDTLNYMKQNPVITPEIMEGIKAKSRDNARTPMQWDDSLNAGFSDVEPWIDINPNYKEINVMNDIKNPNSVYHYYKELIKLRKSNDIIVYGSYEPLLEEDENIFAYTRTLDNQKLLVVNNFSENELDFKIPGKLTVSKKSKILISNYNVENNELLDFKLRPYESRVYVINY